jgi:hypothetical protein
MNRSDHAANDDVEGHQQQQQQQPRNDVDEVAVLPDYKDQARPFPHINAQSVMKTPPTAPTVPTTTTSTTPQPQKMSTRTYDGETMKNRQHGNHMHMTMTTPNSAAFTLPNHHQQRQGGPVASESTTITSNSSENALPLAQAVPISRPVDADSISHEQNQEEDQVGDHDHHRDENNIFSPVAVVSSHRTNTTKQSQSGDGSTNDANDSSSTFLVLKLSRTTFIVIIIASVLILTVAIVGGYCGAGNCGGGSGGGAESSDILVRPPFTMDSGNPINTTTSNTTDTPAESPVADISNVPIIKAPTSSPITKMNDDNSTEVAIESYLRNISLNIESSEDDNMLERADEMAIQWIANEHVSIIESTGATAMTNISDPIVQQRLQQLFAIVTMYYSTTNNENNNFMNWTNTTNWLQPQIHECYWYGITCRIDKKNNSNSNISDVGGFFESDNDNNNAFNRRLQDGTMYDDEFSDTGTDDYTDVDINATSPSMSPIATFRKITSIELRMNNIVGPINPNTGLLTALTKFDLSNNALTGTIPATLLRCTNLRNFKMNDNNLTGTIPEDIVPAWAATIRQFIVGSNLLTGTLPSNIGSWKQILSFEIDNNQFSGTIPETIQNWTEVRTIRLNSNNLMGTIPDEVCTARIANGTNLTITVDENEIECTSACCEYVEVDVSDAPQTAVPVSTLQPLPSLLSASPSSAPVPITDTASPIQTAFPPQIVNVPPFDNSNSPAQTDAPIPVVM